MILSIDKSSVLIMQSQDKVKINGSEYTVSTLPLAPTAPMCKNGVTYQANP